MMERCTIRGKEYLVYEIKQENMTDHVGIQMLEHNHLSGLMPFKFVHEENRDYYRYDVVSTESLDQWLLSKHSKEEVMKLLESILQVYDELPMYLLNKEQLITELPEVSVSEGKCLFAYVPDQELKGDVIFLLQCLLNKIQYPLDEDYSYIFDLQNAYGRGEIRNIADVKKWLKIVNGEFTDSIGEESPVSQPLRRTAESFPVPPKEEQPEQERKMTGKSEELNDLFAEFGIPMAAKAESKEKRKAEKSEKDRKSGLKFLGRKKTEQKPEEEIAEPKCQSIAKAQMKMVINDLNRGDKTVLMDDGGTGGQPSLIRDKNRQEFRLQEGEVLIGSGKDADIQLSDNPAISRKHAKLFVSNGDYYIEDLGSTNGTCVNGEVLLPHVPCLIRDMAHIKISNETFTFCVRS